MRSIRLLTAVVAAIGALPGLAVAQHFSFAPEIGFYIPTQKLSKLVQDGDFTQIEAGPSFGARLGLLFGSRIGIEASGAYIPTTYSLSSDNTITKNDAKLFNGTGQLVFFLLPPTSFLSLYLNGGVGVMSRGGVAFTSAAKKTTVTPVVGGGLGIRLGPIAVTAGADLFAYKAGFEESGQTGEKVSQRDIHLKLGFGMPFGINRSAPSAPKSKE